MRNLIQSARLSSAAAAVLTLGLFTLTHCVCQNRTPDEPVKVADPKDDPGKTDKSGEPAETEGDGQAKAATKPALPDSVDLKDLDEAEQKLLADVLAQQFDPCGKPRSFLESLNADDTCERATKLAGFTVDLVARGLSKRQVVAKLLEELQRTSEKYEFAMEGSPVLGDPASGKLIVEFTDFQCPYCKMASKPIKELAKKHGYALIIKHLPLGHHEHAREAAIASLAANRQGKFWPVYDLFFANQERLDSKVIRELVAEAGVDMKRFDQDVKSPEFEAILERDREEADKSKVDGTPTIFVNGVKVEFDNLGDALQG